MTQFSNKKALFFKKASLLAPNFGPWWITSALYFQYNRLQTIVNSNFVDNLIPPVETATSTTTNDQAPITNDQ